MRAFSAPFGSAAALADAGARRLVRNVRLTVPICLFLICGSFAAATLLSMRMDRTHALNEAALFEAARAHDLASVAGAALDRMAEAGIAYADNPGSDPHVPGLHNVAVYDRNGAVLALLHGRDVPKPPRAAFAADSSAFAAGRQSGIAFAHDGKLIAVTFDAAILAPTSLLNRAALLLPDSSVLAGGWQDSDVRSAAVPSAVRKHWPVTAVTFLDRAGALDAWYGSLPLYLFVILGPALAGGWLAALLVGAFERQQKAAHAIRNLKTLRPVEARLMVRLAAAERAAVEAARSKSEFTAHMSHELRTPLNAVIGFSEVIGEEFYGPAGHPKYVEYARDIADAGRNLHAKIGDILEFSNIEAGRYPLLPEFVDLGEIAAACVDEQKGRAFSRRIDLAVGFAEPGLVRADPRALKRIFSNLLVNALDYTAEGGRVRVDIQDEEGTLVARIVDSGAGFSGAEQRQAGNAFQRFDRAGTVTGAGLGLAIAMELARRLGGAMRLSSEPGAGCVMELRLLKISLPHH
jgi:signal transduction histidine kinase